MRVCTNGQPLCKARRDIRSTRNDGSGHAGQLCAVVAVARHTAAR